LYLNIQRYIPPNLSLELWEYTYDTIANCYLFDDATDDFISYAHKLRFCLPHPIVHPCLTLIAKLEEAAEKEESCCLGTIAVEYDEFFNRPEHELLPVPFIDLELEDPQQVEHEFFSGNRIHIPTPQLHSGTSSAPELSDEDTWNQPWTKYESIHWTSLSEPEESFEVHWSDV